MADKVQAWAIYLIFLEWEAASKAEEIKLRK